MSQRFRQLGGYRTNLLPKDFGRVSESTNDAETARVGHGSCKLRARRNVHTCGATGCQLTMPVCGTYALGSVPASRMGCLIPNISVTGVVIVAMVNSNAAKVMGNSRR